MSGLKSAVPANRLTNKVQKGSSREGAASHPEGGIPLPEDILQLDSEQQERDFAESLIETAQTIILVLDPEGRIIHFNRYLEELSEYSLHELRGQDWFVTFIPEAEQQRMRERFLQGLHKNHIRGANWIRLKDGQLRKIEWSVKLLKDRHNDRIGVLAIGQDITERENAQAALHSLIETIRDAIITINRQGCIELFNPAAERIFGYTQKEFIRQDVRMLMPEPYANEHSSYIERYERTDERKAIGHICTVAAQHKNGQVFPIELSVTEIRSGDIPSTMAPSFAISPRRSDYRSG